MNTYNNEGLCKNPIENQREEALEHYRKASESIHHWSGFVEAAIKAYNPESGAKKEDMPEQFGKVNYAKLKEHVVDDGGKWLKNAEARWQKRKDKHNAEPELKQGVYDGTPPLPSWIEVKKDPPPENTEVLGWNEKWVDEDFNPEGVCVCFIDGDGKWMVAIWDNNMDNWLAHEEGSKRFGMGEAVAPPTHWMQKPIKSN